ncbi:MAG: tRNA (cytidine(34)-2'-O)-methyltransferase [Parasphingorhabdus sp.]|nr:tRNA (cytidine(34)-2'-O)-methyltransferase [Parasphingorhabdus sp.]
MRIALYQPEIAGNVGTILRTSACFGIAVDIIEPCGFAFSQRALRRAGMDYIDPALITRYADWQSFASSLGTARQILFSSKGTQSHTDFSFRPSDILLFGSEGAGVPAEVHDSANARVRIPMKTGMRSLNLAVSVAIALGEALRQIEGYP